MNAADAFFIQIMPRLDLGTKTWMSLCAYAAVNEPNSKDV